MTEGNLIITNALLCLPRDSRMTAEYADITVEGGRVASITACDTGSRKKNYSGFTQIDAGGRVAMLPNVNFHDHFYSRLCKGFAIAGSTENFPLILENLWWKLDSMLDIAMVKASAMLSALEAIRCGVTYVFDHHSSPFAASESLQAIAGELTAYGLRGVLCFEVTDRNGKQQTQAGIDESVRFIRQNCNSHIKPMFGLHASFTVDDATLSAVRMQQQQYGHGIHIHLCEDASDRAMSMERYGKAPLQRLHEHGLLAHNSIVAHAIHITDEERKILAATGTSVVYNLDSNLNNAVGLPQPQLLPEGVTVLMGTDGMHANPVRTLKQLFLLQRHQGASFAEAFGLVQKTYFDGIAFAQRYFPDFSLLQPGDRADMILWDYIPPAPLDGSNFWGHYLYGAADRSVHTVVQGGYALMQDCRFTFPEADAHRFIAEQGSRLKHLFETITN